MGYAWSRSSTRSQSKKIWVNSADVSKSSTKTFHYYIFRNQYFFKCPPSPQCHPNQTWYTAEQSWLLLSAGKWVRELVLPKPYSKATELVQWLSLWPCENIRSVKKGSTISKKTTQNKFESAVPAKQACCAGCRRRRRCLWSSPWLRPGLLKSVHSWWN